MIMMMMMMMMMTFVVKRCRWWFLGVVALVRACEDVSQKSQTSKRSFKIFKKTLNKQTLNMRERERQKKKIFSFFFTKKKKKRNTV